MKKQDNAQFEYFLFWFTLTLEKHLMTLEIVNSRNYNNVWNELNYKNNLFADKSTNILKKTLGNIKFSWDKFVKKKRTFCKKIL